jgi:hypothetical protein
MAEPTPFLTRDALLAKAKEQAQSSPFEPFDVPGLGRIGILKLKSTELDELYKWANARLRAEKRRNPGKKVNLKFRGMILVRTLVDQTGARLFTDDEIGAFDDWPAGTMLPLIRKTQQINGIIDAPKEDGDDEGEE